LFTRVICFKYINNYISNKSTFYIGSFVNTNPNFFTRHEDPGFWCLAATTADLTLALCSSREPRRFTVNVRWFYPPAAVRASSKDHEHRADSRSHRSRERARPYRSARACTCLSPPWSGRELSSSLPVFGHGQPPVHIAPPVGWVGAKE